MNTIPKNACNYIRSIKGLWFGVVDGAQCEDVLFSLERTGLRNRPLYIGLNDKPEQQRTAPFMVSLHHEDASPETLPDAHLIEQFYHQIAEGKDSACVFWQCNAGADVLYRHLRSINKIIIPLERDGKLLPDKTETVLFRHADANVMAQIVSSLTWPEGSRLLGVADRFVYSSDKEWGGSTRCVSRSSEMPPPANGFLQLSTESYQRLQKQRYQGIIGKIEDYLAEVAPKPLPDAQELRRISAASFWQAKGNGIETETGFYRWAYMYYVSGGTFTKTPHIEAVLEDPDSHLSMDERVKQLMKEAIRVGRQSTMGGRP